MGSENEDWQPEFEKRWAKRIGEVLDAKEFASWLIRSGAKTEIYVPPDLGFTVTMDEFASTLAVLCQANHLPTKVTRQTIRWDDSIDTQSRILVEHADAKLSAAKLIVGLDQMGSFYYVEEKLCWDLPADLPAAPTRRITDRPSEPKISGLRILLYIVGGIVFIATLISPLIALGLIIWEFASLPGRREKYEQDLADWEATRKFDRAVETWLKRISDLDNRSRTDDELGRFHLAMKSTIRQTVQKLFLDRHAELRERHEKEMSRQELEAELEKRKNQGFQ